MPNEDTNFRKKAFRLLAAFALLAIILIMSEIYISNIPKPLALLLSHLGTAIFIACFVGMIVEFVEIKQYLEERLFSILVKGEYLNDLAEIKIKELIEKSFESLINRRTTNPEYDSSSLPKEIKDRMLVTLGRTYYEEYTERVEYREVEPTDLEGGKITYDKDISSFNVRTSIVLISPDAKSVTKYFLRYPWAAKRIPGLAKEKHFEVRLWVDDIEQELNFTVEEKGDWVEIIIEKSISFINKVNVVWAIKCYTYGLKTFYSSYVSEWTREAEIIFNTDKPCEPYIEISGITGETYPVDVTDYGANIKYKRWLAPKQGYFITWGDKGSLIEDQSNPFSV